MPTRRKFTLKRALAALVGVTLSAVLLLWLLQLIPLRDIWRAMIMADPGYVLFAAFAATVSIALRGLRWFYLVEAQRGGTLTAIETFSVSLGVNGVLPARAGEIARIPITSFALKIPAGRTVGALAVERLLDSVMILTMLGVSLLILPPLAGVSHQSDADELFPAVNGPFLLIAAQTLATLALLTVIVIVTLANAGVRKALLRLFSRSPQPVRWLSAFIESFLGEFARAAGVLKQARSRPLILALSIAGWLAIVVCNWLAAQSLDSVAIGLLPIFIMSAVSSAASALPSAPGAWGLFEASALAALALMNIDAGAAPAVAFAFLAHAAQYLPTVGLGFLSGVHLWRTKLFAFRAS